MNFSSHSIMFYAFKEKRYDIRNMRLQKQSMGLKTNIKFKIRGMAQLTCGTISPLLKFSCTWNGSRRHLDNIRHRSCSKQHLVHSYEALECQQQGHMNLMKFSLVVSEYTYVRSYNKLHCTIHCNYRHSYR